MLRNLLKKTQEGFTIIEVMIVLAIAGLILVVVLIAVPQLQKNQRNQARQSLASRIVTEINNFTGNNAGLPPTAATGAGASNFGSAAVVTPANTSFMTRYLGCTYAGGAGATAKCTSNIDDPQTGFPVGTTSTGATNSDTTAFAGIVGTPLTAAQSSPSANTGAIHYVSAATCNGEVAQIAQARNFAFMIRLEGGAVYCLDNK